METIERVPLERGEREPLFRSFFMGGFECSTHRNSHGRRLDLVESTRHDRFAREDYERLHACGLRTAREGIRWHRIESSPGRYDFSTVLPVLEAARRTGVQVIWDLCHYGWPDDLDIFSAEFVIRFGRLAREFMRFLSQETDETPFLCAVNEISFFAWAAGAMGLFHPYVRDRGDELKAQLVRAAIEAMEAAWSVRPNARMVHIDPMCNVVADPENPDECEAARGYCEAQYHAWDMLAGRSRPDLGGDERYLDIIGVNYYPDNQWLYPGNLNSDTTIHLEHPLYVPPSQLLRRVYERYRRPVFVAETGIEDERRPLWLRYVGQEVRRALREGVPVEGICLYPILNHPGWEDDRHCHNGLWDYADDSGHREPYVPLARELERQQHLLARQLADGASHDEPAGTFKPIWQNLQALGFTGENT